MNSINLLVKSIDNMYHTPEESPDEKIVTLELAEGPLTPPTTPKQSQDDRKPNNTFEEKLLENRTEDSDSMLRYHCKSDRLDIVKEDTGEIPEDIVSSSGNSKQTHFFSLATVLFIPNYLVIKPILLMWLILTYPFTYSFEALGIIRRLLPKLEFPYSPESVEYEATIEEEAPIKTEIIKRDNMISNTIKSPTSASKYIIPVPPRLYPLSRNPGKKKRKTLILDLDETLIHSLARTSPRISTAQLKMIEIKINNVSTLYYVYKRPCCDYFLKEIANWFDLQIFTASVQEYADPIIDWLESEIVTSKATPLGPLFLKRYYRNDCTYRKGVGYVKDLSKFFPREELKNVLILDNSPVSYAKHERNAVMIEGWINDTSDRDLLNLLPMLYGLSMAIDVRLILGMRYGERIFE